MDWHRDISIVSLIGRLDLGELSQYLFILFQYSALVILEVPQQRAIPNQSHAFDIFPKEQSLGFINV
jgi:hypothetical protein